MMMLPSRTSDDPLTRAMAPPPNETGDEMQARISAELEAKRISDEIDEELKRDRLNEKKNRPLRILLLGQSESGKSTTLKNFQIMYTPKAFRAELASWRAVIQLNVIKSIRVILDTLDDFDDGIASGSSASSRNSLNPELRKRMLRLRPVVTLEDQLLRRLGGPGQVEAVRRQGITSQELSVAPTWKESIKIILGRQSREDDVSTQLDDPDGVSQVLSACKEDMVALWADPVVQRVLALQDLRLEDQGGFFLNDVDRLTQKSYTPTDDDVLRCRLKTIGVSTFNFRLESTTAAGQEWKIYDVGGARSQRLYWTPFFDAIDAIIFLAPISCFDQTLAEDANVNRLEDSVSLFRDVVSNKLLENVQLVLFLNKIDILRAKIAAGVSFAKHVTTYGERPNEADSIAQYLKRKFASIQKEKSPIPRHFYCHITSMTDTAATQTLLARISDLVVRAHLKGSNLI